MRRGAIEEMRGRGIRTRRDQKRGEEETTEKIKRSEESRGGDTREEEKKNKNCSGEGKKRYHEIMQGKMK